MKWKWSRVLAEDVFAVSALRAILNASKHQILELALRSQLDPFGPGWSVEHSFELRINANLCSLRCSRSDLKAQDVASSCPIAHFDRRHLAKVFKLTLCCDALDEHYRFAEQRAFAGVRVAVFLVERNLS